jgi:hypothetical protein
VTIAFIPIWIVVVDGRIAVRSWNDKPGGWYRAFIEDESALCQWFGSVVGIHQVMPEILHELAPLSDRHQIAYAAFVDWF